MLNPWFQQKWSVTSLSKVAAWRLAEWKVLRDARAVLFTCEEERELAVRSYSPYSCTQEVLTVVGTSVPPTEPGGACDAFYSQFPHLKDKRIILYLGRLHPMKGCDLLIRAFSSVCYQDFNLHLVVAGPGEDAFRKFVRKLAKDCAVEDRISLVGPLYEEAKWGALRAASLFALPSHCEAFPVALLEALGTGVPALITNRVNIWRYVAEAKAGFVDTDTVEGTIRSLRRWIGMSELEIQVMRKSACDCFRENFEATSSAVRFVAGLRKHGVNC